MITIDLLPGDGSQRGNIAVSSQCSKIVWVTAPSTTKVEPGRQPSTSSAGSTDQQFSLAADSSKYRSISTRLATTPLATS
jgi:hypothetical protein